MKSRFQSQKRRREINKTLFRATESVTWLFNRVRWVANATSQQFKNGFGALFFSRNASRSLHAYPLIAFILILAITSVAESNKGLTRQLDTVFILPGIVKSSGWHAPENALVQDVDETGVYQSFTKSNAAYFDGREPKTEEIGKENKTAPETTPPENTPPQSSEGLPQSDDSATEPTSVEEEGAETPAGETEGESETVVPESTADEPEPTELAPEAAPQVLTETPLQALSRSFFLFTDITTLLLPFAQESIVAPVEEANPVSEEFESSPASEEPTTIPEEPAEEPVETPVEPDNVLTVPPLEEEIPTSLPETPASVASPETGTDTSTSSPGSGEDTVPEDMPGETTELVNEMLFEDFALPALEPGQLVKNMQLRLSLGGLVELHGSSTAPEIRVEYTLGKGWMSAGSIVLDGEVSNALNGGYHLFALEKVDRPKDLAQFAVRLSYQGPTGDLERVYLDSIWLELDTETFDRTKLKERLLPEELGHLALPSMYELLSADLDFTRAELPKFSLRYESQRNIIVRLVRELLGRDLAEVMEVSLAHVNTGPVSISPRVDVTEDGLITVQLSERDKRALRPGEYSMTITVDEGGKKFSDTFNFQWGLLSVNPDQTEYELGDESTIALGALTRNGNTLCDANLALYVIDPQEYFYEVPVSPSGLCNGNNVIDVPDYSARFTPTATGTYTMYVERLDEDGSVLSHTEDTFMVVDAHDVALRRTGPTRIYPPAPYPMTLTVLADVPFEGTLTERIPRTFTITETDAEVREVGDVYELSWDISLGSGESASVSYTFDAPDLSPYLYLLGPATLAGEDTPSAVSITETGTSTGATGQAEVIVEEAKVAYSFTEHRSWQIASDATGNMLLFWDNTGGIPSGWTCVSCAPGDPFYQRFIMGSSTYNATGGATTHTPNASSSLLTSSSASTESGGTGGPAVVSHTHTYTPTIGSGSNLPAYRQLRVIQYTASAGEPASIPTGAIGIFDDTLPSGWTQYNANNGRYIYGENTPGTTGGADTHTHSITGTTGAAAGGSVQSRGGGTQTTGATAAHTHTVSTSTPAVNHEPPYLTVMLGQLNATATAPNGLVTMWTDEVPASWINMSASGDPFSGRFVKATSTYGATGGSSTHAHSDMTTIVTGAPSATTNARTGTAGASAGHTHTVTVTNFTTVSNLPPYVTAVFGKRFGTNPLLTQLSSRWYVNTNAQLPTDPWPSGATDLTEQEAISATSTPVKNGDIIRLRVNALVSNATATASTTLKLQYASTTGACSAITSWTNVGAATSSVEWIGYNNTSVSDHSTISTSTLASTTVNETYEENGYTVAPPNNIAPGGVGEWDFVLRQNSASAGATYCFRLAGSDGSSLFAYQSYPTLFTNEAPEAPTPSKLFDNEKTASTSPWFEFVTTDAESQDLNYQIQIDNDFDFSSTVVDDDTENDPTLFENLVVPSDKDPFNQGQLMRYSPSTSFTNGVTHWWRVRARDPQGSNQWGEWSTQWSFTIDTSLTASAWFQTTEEQFDTDTLVDLDAVGSDQLQLATGSSTGTMTTDAIDFDNGSLGTAWDSLSWNDTETAGDIKYHIEYLDDTLTWTEIPDSVLSGNSAGFDTSPVDLLDLDTNTYNDLRIVADFTNSGGSPSLQDITLSWGYRVETPTLTKLFPNEKTGTTTPTFEFTTSDPQADSLTYQVSWSTDRTFATGSTTRTSDTHLGFVNADSGGDLDPFDSGDTIRFTLQGADALANNTTYWWRVRAKDTTGDNAYSLWSEPRSFTVDTTVTVSTWFQTTEEQFDTNILSGTDALASDAVSVATTATEAMLVYGEGVQSAPRYRLWSGSAWGSEGTLQDVGAPVKWTVVKAGVTREEYVAATLGTDADVNVQVYALGAWGNLQEVTSAITDVSARGFDIAYESTSGDAMVAFCDGDADPSYYIWNGSTWTSGGTINLGTTGSCAWVELASDPTSDEIIVLSHDTAGAAAEAQVWDGNAWGNSTTLGSIVDTGNEGLSVEYEESGGQAIVISSDGNPARFRYNTWNGSAWSGALTQAIGNDFEWGQLVRDVGSDELALCYLDEDSDIGMVHWTGAAWTGQTELDIDGNAKNDPPFSCVYETTAGRDNYVMTVYSDTAAANYSYWNNASWSAEAQINSIGDSATMRLVRTGVGTILGVFFDDPNDDLLASSWNGTSWSTTTTIENNASVDTTPFGHPYDLVSRNSGLEGTVIVSPGIEFSDGTGPLWDTFSWVDSTPGTSDILYSVQYYNAASGTWAFIPDAVLPGNSTGTSTSPIDLSNLNTSTYGTIRPYALLTCQNASTCPTLQDWTVTWTEGITVSGTLHEYDQVSSSTSGTIAVAVNGILQVGKTGSVSNGAWSISNVTTFPGDIVTVFVSGATDADEAVGVTRYDGSGDVTGLSMYKRHLSIGSNDATSTPITNSDIGLYDFTTDEDLLMNATATALSLCVDTGCGDAELIVKAGAYYRPEGTLTVHDFENNGTFLPQGNAITVSGSWDNNATATMATSTVTFSATSTAETVTSTGAIEHAFYNITFGSAASTATWTLGSALDIENDMAVNFGTLSRGGTPITIAGSLSTGASGLWSGIGTTTFDGTGTDTWSDASAGLQNIGHVVVDGTSKTVQFGSNVKAQSLTIGADDILDAVAARDITLFGDWINNNTFVARTGEVVMAATTTNRTITVGGDAFYDLTFSGAGGGWSFSEAALSVGNDFRISTGTVTMPTGTTTVAGSWNTAGGAFGHNNSTIVFTSGSAETIAASGTPFTNNFHILTMNGAGSWSFLDQNATTSNDFRIQQGSVTLPSGTLAVGNNFMNTGGSFAHNSGTVRFTGTATHLIDTASSFSHLTFAGSGSWSFLDASVTAVGSLSIQSGSVTLPSGTLTLGGSFQNSATFAHNSGTVLFNSTDVGETVNPGQSSFARLTFNSATGGWTISESATSTGSTTLTAASSFTLASGRTLSVGGVFTNSVGGASTTWTGSTLSLEAGAYSINTKTSAGDTYENLRIKANTDIAMWNSSAGSYDVDVTSSLYSQDHTGVDGDLYIFGNYVRSSGNEYWSYATDFDGTALGGSSRQVDVRFSPSSSATIIGGLFEILGVSGATTTIANQGSGRYFVSVNTATTTFSYYDFDDLNTAGVAIQGGSVVTSLSDGRFVPSFAAGSGLSVSSSTIDANPGLQIYRVEFTAGVPGTFNVNQSDGAPSSYWWFRESSGDLDGEAFDQDTGDPGSIRWDDSSLVITVSGTVYSDDGVNPMGNPTCDDSTSVIRIVVEGGSAYTGSCASADGSYSIPGVVVVGDPVVVAYLDTNGGAKAAVVTKTPTADISDLDLYQNRVMTRHEDVLPLTILDMAFFDADNDSDISFRAATGTLEVYGDTELHIASSTEFAPGGDITIFATGAGLLYDGTLHIDDNATFTGSGTSTYTLGGSFMMDTGASFAPASTTVIMNATTTGKTIITSAGQEIGFNELEFNGIGGGWNINGNIRVGENITVATGTVSGTHNITVVRGSFSGEGLVSMGSGTTTIERLNTLGGTQGWTFGNLVLGNGSVTGTTTPASNATTTILGKLTIATGHYLNAHGSRWNLRGTGNVFVESGTFLEGTSTVRYSGTGAANVLSTGYYDLELKALGGSPTYTATGLGIVVANDLTVGGATTTAFTLDTNDPALDVAGDVIIESTGTLVGSGNSAFTVAGNWVNDGVFTASGGTVTFDGGGTSDIYAGASTFANVVVNGTGSFTVPEHATATAAFTLTNAGAFTLASGQSLAVGGTFTNSEGGAATTWTGSVLHLYGGGNYTANASTTNDSYETLRIGSGTQIRTWNSDASSYDLAGTASLYSQDHANVSGDLYIFGAYVKTSGTDHWSYTTDFDGTTLGTTSARAVDVRIRNGSSVLYTGGGLAVVGDAGASTTIENQGSGTYAFRIGGSASTSWSYYDLRHVDASGLVLSGTPNVVTLSRGSIEVGQNNGTALTVGGTVITQNPAKTFTNNRFATSTGISPAVNVTATGTSVSSWRFTNHTGEIDGEAFDVDPDGDPGYIVWDDSAANITISGNVYSDEGTTVSGVCDGSTSNIHIRVAGLTSYTGSCDGGTGLYSIPNVSYSPGDSLIVYIDGETEKAATVTEDPVSNINDMDLYEDRVIVRHENTDPLSILDMSVWDSSDDADIPFSAVDGSPDTLTIPANGDRKLIVWDSKTFRPAGNVSIPGGGGSEAYDGMLEVYDGATFDATGSETHTIGGSFILGTGSVLDEESSTFVFTTSGAGRTIDTNEYPFYNVTLNGSGSWTVANTAFEIGNDLTITQGTVTLPSGTTTVTGTLNVNGGAFVANGGTMLLNSSAAETVRAGGSSFHALTINGSGSFTMQDTNATATADVLIENGTLASVSGTFAIAGDFINSDTFTHNSGTLRFTSPTSTTVTASSSDLSSVTFSGNGAHVFTDEDLALLGTLRIEAGSVLLPSGTMSVGGSLLNIGGSFNNASGTILFNSGDVGETVNPGASPFHNVSFASAGGGWTVAASATSTGNFSLTSASNFTLSSGSRLYVGGVFTNLVGGAATTWTGSTLIIHSGSGYTVNTKAAGGDAYANLRVGSSTALRMWDSTATTTIEDSVSSLYSQDHAGVAGSLYIYGNYVRSAGADYWSYATDFDGAALGGSSRQAFVYHASGASTTISGGTLNIVGTNGFDTMVSNQGSGVYGMTVQNGSTLNAQYYSFENMGVNGLVLSGASTVSSLSEGNFTLTVSGGSLITLSSTTLNHNAGLVVTGASFATTSAITGYNVNLVGSTPSAWTFTSHSGNFDGETFDNDGGDACGSIRWSDSSCLLTEETSYRWRNDDGGEGVPNSEWYDQNWTKRKRVTITNADAVSYANAAVEVPVPYDADMQADFDDLRFTASNGTTLIEHFIETYTASTEATVWVEIPLLATSTDTEVYMYYGNGGATNGSATSTFAFMDNFEDGNISEYSGDTGIFAVDGSFAYERSNGLDATGNESGKATDGIYRTDVTVRQGQTLRFFQYIDTVAGSGDETCTMFGVQSPGSNNQNYAVCLELFGTDRVSISRDVDFNDTSGTILASTTITYVTGWHEVEVDWDTDDSISVTVLRDDVVVATTSASDGTYTEGGVGFTFWFQNGGWDIYSARPLIATAPTTTFGGEQVSGGASWLAAENSPAPGVATGDRARVRFIVENSGLAITAQNFELEYAQKGASPSCEAVDYNDYVEVPNIASCGVSEMCMATSSHITNLEATTDLLGGEGIFTAGQVVEDPSNNTGNLDVDGGEYTELEYVISPSATVADSAYCFRVTNEGSELDSYARVAELQLVFEPNITALSLNSGMDIVLTAGATTTVMATGTVSDQNGYADIITATTTIFRSGVGEACSPDNNNCYIAGPSQCSFTNCSGNSCDVECSVDMYYHADPTDIGTFAGETWRALLAVEDGGAAVATATAPSIDLLTVRAIAVDSTIDYGTLAVNADTGAYNATTTVENIGNDSIDVAIEGTDLTDGGSSAIPVSEQIFATSTFTYSACTYCSSLATTSTNFELNLTKPSTTTPAVVDDIFWGIAVPFGVAGTAHSGTNTFYAVGD